MLDSPNELVIDDTVTFKSARDGSTIAFTISSRNEDETQFIVSVKTPSSIGSAVASTYHSGPPNVLFEEIAENWQGWTGQKSWEDLESRVSLTAESDRLGHATVVACLCMDNGESRLRASFVFEAGQFNDMARAISTLFIDSCGAK